MYKSNDREKSSEKYSYTAIYGDKKVTVNTTISQTRKDNGEKDSYIHRNWKVNKK